VQRGDGEAAKIDPRFYDLSVIEKMFIARNMLGISCVGLVSRRRWRSLHIDQMHSSRPIHGRAKEKAELQILLRSDFRESIRKRGSKYTSKVYTLDFTPKT